MHFLLNSQNDDILNSEFHHSKGVAMSLDQPVVTTIKGRGQLTIPKKIRETSHLEEGQVVSIIAIGDSVIITPRRMELDEARREIRKIMKDSGLTGQELLDGLEQEREELYRQVYEK